MESLVKIIILAIIQGVTEFLPVSSSGHLVVARGLFGLESPGATLEVALHMGTLFAILLFFWRDLTTLAISPFRGDPSLRRAAWKQISLIAVATVPIVLVGVFFSAKIESMFTSTRAVGFLLLGTAVVLTSTRFARAGTRDVDVPRSLLVGIAQAVAILPGISRSGTTIALGELAGVKPSEAARFSFLIAVPATIGAIIWEAVTSSACFRIELVPGIVVSAVVGYFSLKLLINVVKSNKLWMFGPYCAVVGLVAILFL